MTIIHDFKSLRDHMDKIIQRDEAREQADAPRDRTQKFWCHVCGYKATCTTCKALAKP